MGIIAAQWPLLIEPYWNWNSSDAKIYDDEEIAFNAGSHTELIRMNYLDYEKLVKPKILRFANKYKT